MIERSQVKRGLRIAYEGYRATVIEVVSKRPDDCPGDETRSVDDGEGVVIYYDQMDESGITVEDIYHEHVKTSFHELECGITYVTMDNLLTSFNPI